MPRARVGRGTPEGILDRLIAGARQGSPGEGKHKRQEAAPTPAILRVRERRAWAGHNFLQCHMGGTTGKCPLVSVNRFELQWT